MVWSLLHPLKVWSLRQTRGDSLYNLDSDFSQSNNVASEQTEKLNELIKKWDSIAKQNNVYPIDHRFVVSDRPRGVSPEPRELYEFWGDDIQMPLSRAPNFIGNSFHLVSHLTVDRSNASGAVFAAGSILGGWSLLMDEGRPSFVYALSTKPSDITVITAEHALKAGEHSLGLRFVSNGLGKDAEVSLLVGDQVIAGGRIPKTLLTYSSTREMIEVGRDGGVPVTDYKTKFGEFEGSIDYVSVRITSKK